jgi:hypothetical protein
MSGASGVAGCRCSSRTTPRRTTSSPAPPHLFGEELVLSASLLRVAVGIATFTGLYYAIALITDAMYREEFLSGVVEDLREVFTIRAEYLRARAESAPPAPAADPTATSG